MLGVENGSMSPLVRRRHQYRRWVPIRLRAGGVKASVLTLTTSAFGAGLFTLPYAVKLTGVLGVILLLGLSALLSLVTTNILVDSVPMFPEADSFSSLAQAASGEWAAVFVDSVIALEGALIGGVFLIFLGDFVPPLLEDIRGVLHYGSVLSPEAVRTLVIVGTAIVMLPFSAQRTIGALRYVAVVYVSAVVLTAIVVVLKCPALFIAHHATSPINWIALNWGTAKAANICLFAFVQHLNVVPVAVEMRPHCRKRSHRVTTGAASLEFLLYALLSMGGYLSFLSTTKQNFMNNYDATDGLLLLNRAVLAVCLMFAVPMVMISVTRSIRELTSRVSSMASRPSRLRAGSLGIDREAGPNDAINSRPQLSKPLLNNVSSPIGQRETAEPSYCRNVSHALPPAAACQERPGEPSALVSNRRGSSHSRISTKLSASPVSVDQMLLASPAAGGTPAFRPVRERVTSSQSLGCRLISVVPVLGFNVAFALRIRQVATAVSFVGGIFSVLLMAGIPGLIYIGGCGRKHSALRYYVTTAALVISFMIGLFNSIVIVYI